ncbi:CU044_5270 family protein [Amycolatopsis sp. 195334CR]|uniref:CU044_5270 family protein n=1 Tax=Amycolatopsis sp. 195334CR TaxID=2814588 RepID=UPI001A8CE753|nr:CU044_5270 family protein [Amycolatopsis sp. 195334CR]MBN6036171.1 CU044_5270 family protein [Amycolatopsis sp. 195334CR]
MSDQRELDEALAMLHQRERTAAPDLDALRARVLAGPQHERKKRWLLPVAAAAVVLAGVTAVQVTREAPEEAPPAAPPASGVPLLEHAAKTNADARWRNEGTYLHVVTRGTRDRTLVYGNIADDDVVDSAPNSGYTEVYEQRVESWVPLVPDLMWREKRSSEGETRWVGGNDLSRIKPATPWLKDGDWTAPCGNYFPAEKPKTACGGANDPASPSFYATVPTEPAEILSWLRKRSNAPLDSGAVFAEGVELMSSGVMPKERYANWYRALAMIDGVRDYGDVTLPDGKVGAALGVPSERERRELVIDRNDGRFLGERRIAGPRPKQSWIPEGTVVGLISVTSEQIPRPDGL